MVEKERTADSMCSLLLISILFAAAINSFFSFAKKSIPTTQSKYSNSSALLELPLEHFNITKSYR